jgi:hypothetical protein
MTTMMMMSVVVSITYEDTPVARNSCSSGRPWGPNPAPRTSRRPDAGPVQAVTEM